MLAGLISYALLAALATALLVAAVTDLRRREIDNWLNAAIALAAPLYWLAVGLDWVAVLFQLGLALLTFAIACALFAMRQMGGGDVKLLSALALWFVPHSFLQVIVIMGLTGGAASVAMAVFNMKRKPAEGLRNGLSTFAATLWVMGACTLAYPAVTGRPLIDADALFAALAVLPKGWPLALIGALMLALFLAGMSHIFRRQRGAIPIPYGVAISAASLCVLAQDVVSAPLSGLLQG
ncbi:prepilin peptidase [Novosphingobium sp. RD2P27]|uniref:Prepilin peptidase n=1 Tax=Novosphingobium kalidii TaxID=3230299 RepID=A0ABV2D179_9SPHN